MTSVIGRGERRVWNHRPRSRAQPHFRDVVVAVIVVVVVVVVAVAVAIGVIVIDVVTVLTVVVATRVRVCSACKLSERSTLPIV